MKEIIKNEYEKFKDLMDLYRVITVNKTNYVLSKNNKLVNATISGRLRYNIISISDYPVVGDYVMIPKDSDDVSVIERIIPRYSELSRLGVGQQMNKQVFAANIDLVFIVLSMNVDFNLTKLRNFINISYSANVETVIILTKKDLVTDIDYYVNEVSKVVDSKVLCVNSFDVDDINRIKNICLDKTSILIGSSGVGKSTIINSLINEQHFKTNTIRTSDDQGRHTTVHRELIEIEKNSYIIDTPGIRIINSHIIGEIDEHFDDIFDASKKCSFRDCSHQHEPGCNVLFEIDNGTIEKDRLEQYFKALKYNRFLEKRNKNKEKKA
ncbi:ribosome small subunit-dependent GTPase A [Candidatus Izimaplasma bacterium ZiA1]|uniref:ribosome small subunit-dependent GTPase A n=1 Tax=Candidatus Izimoplasma sp. ZiA1 TaxID=2024899 RepID=UPI000BAA61EF|nr:ribosome small subunit-dependent GTPase A [Candidatus Izimaplasma bacterium ZiA1]